MPLSHPYIDLTKLPQHVNTFVYEIGRLEPDLERRKKIDELQLSDEEWKNVGLFLNLLGVSH